MTVSEYEPRSKEDLNRFEELVLQILRKYIAKYYRLIQQRVTTQYMELEDINEMKPIPMNWDVSVSKEQRELVDSLHGLKKEIKQMINEGEFVYRLPSTGLPEEYEAYIERHLFQPLLTVVKDRENNILEASPPALEKSEQEFVTDLRNFLSNIDTSNLTADQVFLLRNQSRGKGVGFYENEGFYPDFILWLLEKTLQRIIFIEPHGMIHDTINEQNDKVTQFKRLHTISNNASFLNHRVKMDSFIITKTDFTVLSSREGMDKDTFAKKWHILFRTQDPNYLSPIFQDSDTS